MESFAVESIRNCIMFSGMSDEDVREIFNHSQQANYKAGECLMEEGEPGDSLLVILDGEVEVVRDAGDSEAMLARFGPGSFVGEMALIGEGTRTATVRALAPTSVLIIGRETFHQLVSSSPSALLGLVRTILQRLKSTELMMVNQEKMAALGRISAGLAHEMNNPASALRRSAEQMQGLISDWQESTILVSSSTAASELQMCFSHLKRELLESQSHQPARLSALERANREDEIADWLESRGVTDGWDHAGNLAAAGWTTDRLEELCGRVGSADIGNVMAWMSQGLAVHSTLVEMRSSAERLTSIVDSVKRYSHMDRAAAALVNINHGIETTLTMLRHKMKNVRVELMLDQDLPEIEGYPAEMNQVWTNLIDNAVDAMDGTGSLRISSAVENGDIVVHITDSGSGIDEEHLRRLFEPFFTTKNIGSGTGLGLHITRNIVVQRHSGQIDVRSRPGETTFTVSLPIGT